MFNDCMLYNAKKMERMLTQIAEEEFSNIGLHHTYGYILTVIASQEYVKTKTISCELALDSSTVTRMVSKLEKEGLVIKGSEHSPVDISLSAEGRKLLPEIKKAWDNYHERCRAILGSEFALQLNSVMQQANEGLCTRR